MKPIREIAKFVLVSIAGTVTGIVLNAGVYTVITAYYVAARFVSAI